MKLLFIYGTLKTGECRSSHLAGQGFRCMSQTEPDYLMFRVSDYPGLIEVEQGNGKAIVGEVWQVDEDCLERLDQVEGVDEGYYERRLIRLQANCQHLGVEAYFYSRTVAGCEDCGSCW